jgi:CRP-like cAMP-binding protein
VSSTALPLVDPVQRALYLRTLPMFQGLGSPQVAALARLVEERIVEAGTVICEEGAVPSEVFILVEGRVTESKGGFDWSREAPTGLGSYNLFVGEGNSPRIVAETDLRLLALHAMTFLDLIEEDFDVMFQVRRILMQRVMALRAETATIRPFAIRDHTAGPSDIDDRPVDGLVDKIRLLADAPSWGSAYVDDLAELAMSSHVVVLEAGDVLWLAGESTERFAIVATGTIRCTDEASGLSYVARRRDSIGGDVALSGVPHIVTAVAEVPSTVLSVGTEEILQLAEMHTSLGMTALRATAKEVLHLEQLCAENAASSVDGVEADR